MSSIGSDFQYVLKVTKHFVIAFRLLIKDWLEILNSKSSSSSNPLNIYRNFCWFSDFFVSPPMFFLNYFKEFIAGKLASKNSLVIMLPSQEVVVPIEITF